MKKLTALLFAIVCLSFASSALAVPPLCGSVCQVDWNSTCYCEYTCNVANCSTCINPFDLDALGVTPSWMAETAPTVAPTHADQPKSVSEIVAAETDDDVAVTEEK